MTTFDADQDHAILRPDDLTHVAQLREPEPSAVPERLGLKPLGTLTDEIRIGDRSEELLGETSNMQWPVAMLITVLLIAAALLASGLLNPMTGWKL